MVRNILYALVLSVVFMTIFTVSWQLLGGFGGLSDRSFTFGVIAGFVGLVMLGSHESE